MNNKIKKLIKNDIVKVQFNQRHYYMRIVENNGAYLKAFECNYHTGRASTILRDSKYVTYNECEDASMIKVGHYNTILDRIKNKSFDSVNFQ